MLGSPITAEQALAARVLVNLFDGGPRSELVMVVDDRAPVPMRRVSKPDPFVVQLYARHRDTIKPWPPCRPGWRRGRTRCR